jgi:hypothetical protein
VTVTVESGSGGGLDDDFEGSVAGWSTSGLWHLATNSTCASPQNGYSSPVRAFYYGQDSTCNYSTGAANTGTLTSPPISGITSSSTLTFDYYRQVESFTGGSFDQTEVEIVHPGGADTVFALDSGDASSSSWQSSGPISLAAYAGDTIQVRFRFDSVDNVANTFDGWFIDDVAVTGVSSCGPPVNTGPTVTITAPADPTTVTEGTAVTFSGTATDAEDGNLTAALSWSSNLDGPIGSGGSFSATLSVGTHTVTASVTDSDGLSGSDQVTVIVEETPNTPPTVTITAPADPTTVEVGTSVTFTGTATDAEDGNLTASLSWSSNLDGPIGSGGSFSTSSLSVGTHTVTASVTDSGGLSGSDNVTVIVTPVGGGCSDCIDWSVTPTEGYGGQDISANVTVEDGGDTILLQANTWRRTTSATTFTITADTVLEFEFSSSSQGEIHGIGFDEDNNISNAERVFQLYGNQNWAPAIEDFRNYPGGGGFVSYSIPVGQYYTGSGFRLVLVNDKDSGALTNNSRFRNVRVFEDAPVGCSVDDDFEGGAAGWVNAAGSTCTTGDWVLGTPTVVTNGGVTTQVGGDHTPGSGVNAIFTAVNTSAGVDDVDGGNCILESPVFSVGEASDLTVWYFHGQRDNGTNNTQDFFLLEVSTNGGSSYTPIVSIGDDTSQAVWTLASASIPAGSNVRLRVQASDAGTSGDLVEGGIDDLRICPSN